MTFPKKSSYSQELAQRKEDHIDLAHKARTSSFERDKRFNYEPLFFTHPREEDCWPTEFLGHQFDYPLWISSMTGGTDHARKINQNLARLAGEFKLGMGLGSCRALLRDQSRLEDFKVKKFMEGRPLFANLGIAQIEELLRDDSLELVDQMMEHTQADGLMIHINPLQEWFQPEGDRFEVSPLETLKRFLEKKKSYKVMVKEVGQGMGPRSLKALLELPIEGIELGAFGGTNFTLLEKMRGQEDFSRDHFIYLGHTAGEMVDILNALPTKDKEIIISGGVKSMLDGLELKSKLKANSLIGMASGFLTYALEDYETLRSYFLSQRESLLVARALVELREE